MNIQIWSRAARINDKKISKLMSTTRRSLWWNH